MIMKYIEITLILCIVIILTSFGIKLYLDNKKCTENGGELVRGVVWFKCMGDR